MNKNYLKKLKNIKCFLLDMDGTLYLGNKALPGAVDFIKKLKENNIKKVFLSNNSSKNKIEYLHKLRGLNIPAKKDDIFTSLTATMIYLKSKKIYSIFPVGTPGFVKELKLNGFKTNDLNPKAVVLGFDMTLTYKKIQRAYELICSGAKFIATHPDILCPAEKGFLADIGGFIAMFEKLTGISPVIIGKPYPTMIQSVLKKYNIRKENTAIIGDRIYTDIKMGKNSGILSILVLSGETKSVKNASIVPDIVVKNIGELIQYI